MNHDHRSDRDPLIGFLVRRNVPPPGDCPDPNLLAGRGEGRLPEADRAALDAHLASCPTCGIAVSAVEDLEPAEGAARPRFRLLGRPVSGPARVAAAVLLASAAGLGALAIFGRAETTTDARLLASARDLAERRPDLFGGFAPLDPSERATLGGGPERGGIALLHPVGVLLEVRPRLRWEPVPGAPTHRIRLLAEGGEELWTRESSSGALPFPEDAPDLTPGAAYLWEVAAEGPFGTVRARRAFRVADEEARRSYEEARREIRATVPDPEADLLEAHLAVRRGLLAEGEAAVRRYLGARPEDDVGRETLALFLRSRGASEEGGATSR